MKPESRAVWSRKGLEKMTSPMEIWEGEVLRTGAERIFLYFSHGA
jgi:hypothetical protein